MREDSWPFLTVNCPQKVIVIVGVVPILRVNSCNLFFLKQENDKHFHSPPLKHKIKNHPLASIVLHFLFNKFYIVIIIITEAIK